MKIAEVFEKPNSGQWVEQHIAPNGCVFSNTYRITDTGTEEYYSKESDKWKVNEHHRGTDSYGHRYFIAQPSFHPITFDYPWQVEQWLCENIGERLYFNPEQLDTYCQWINGVAIHKCSGISDQVLRYSHNSKNLTWYIKEGEQ